MNVVLTTTELGSIAGAAVGLLLIVSLFVHFGRARRIRRHLRDVEVERNILRDERNRREEQVARVYVALRRAERDHVHETELVPTITNIRRATGDEG